MAGIIFGLAVILIIAIIAGVIYLIVKHPGEALIILLAVIVGIVLIAVIVILLQVFVGIHYAFKGPRTQTNMSYDIDDQEHAESFDEAKEVPPARK